VSVIDPVRYEILRHRLWVIGEEGRAALQRVSASPIVVQGGECMQSFYDASGRMVLACSGHLRFAAATSDAIKLLIREFGSSPGFYEGDQIFNNDPYVAGSHTYDQMVVMPIFAERRLIGWTASSSHTADTGGLLRGTATEIYHEGLRVRALKVVERGQFRDDVCKTIVEQCRDPYYVELDLRSRVAANNVSGARVLRLVEQFGLEFVEAAMRKMIEDSERLARAKLRELPDGTWRSRTYATAMRSARPFQVRCTMTKARDEVSFDFAGTSPQQDDDQNSTLPSTLAHVALALTNMLFWDVPWSDGKMAPVRVLVPEGTFLNCRFPAACGGAPRVGQILVSAVTECVAKMLYAAGRLEEVNAGWQGLWYQGGPGYFYGGTNANGLPVAQGLYDIHGGGFGATPLRDGVDTGGHANIPAGGISDVERIELSYPFLYFARNHNPDGAGYGRHRGGAGSHRLYMVYGSSDLTVDFRPYGGIPNGGFGLFGGYPCGTGGMRAILATDPVALARRLAEGRYPTSGREAVEGGWATVHVPEAGRPRVALPERWLVSDFVQSGGGFGDPLEREPETVARDVASGFFTRDAAERFFGVRLDRDGAADLAATDALRDETRARRRRDARASADAPATLPPGDPLATPHHSLEIVRASAGARWRCRRCGADLGDAAASYKRSALRAIRPLGQVSDAPLPAGDFIGELHEYYCPGCVALLQVDVFCPTLGDDALLHDIALAMVARAPQPA